MKKKIVLGVFLLFILFLLFHLSQIGNYYYNELGNKAFTQNDFTGALNNFSQAQSFLDTPKTEFNLGTTYYKQGKYEQAQSYFEQLLSKKLDDETRFKTLHNLGNTLYQVGKKQNKISDTIEDYKKSIESYSQALQILQDEATKNNKEFVEKELEKLQKGEKQQDTKDTKTSTSTGSTDSQGTKEKKSGESQDSQKNDTTGSKTSSDKSQKTGEQSSPGAQRGDEYKLDGSTGVQNLTPEEQKNLDQYQKELQRVQRENQGSFNIQGKEQNDMFDIFSSDPFFSNQMGGTAKDW